MVTRRRLNATL